MIGDGTSFDRKPRRKIEVEITLCFYVCSWTPNRHAEKNNALKRAAAQHDGGLPRLRPAPRAPRAPGGRHSWNGASRGATQLIN